MAAPKLRDRAKMKTIMEVSLAIILILVLMNT